MKLDVDIYNHIYQNGLQLTSPATDIANQSIGALSTVEQQLDETLLPEVDPAIIASTKSVVINAQSGMNNTVAHIAANTEKTLSISSVSSQINRLDAFVGGVPTSCFNTDSVMGMVMGEANDMLSAVGDKATLANQAIADFLAGVINTTQLEALLGSISDEISSAAGSVMSLVNAEQAQWNEVISKLSSSSATQTITQLWDDPCTKAILDKTLPDDIKQKLPSG